MIGYRDGACSVVDQISREREWRAVIVREAVAVNEIVVKRRRKPRLVTATPGHTW